MRMLTSTRACCVGAGERARFRDHSGSESSSSCSSDAKAVVLMNHWHACEGMLLCLHEYVLYISCQCVCEHSLLCVPLCDIHACCLYVCVRACVRVFDAIS